MSSHEVLMAFLGTLSEDALRLLTQNPLAIKETITRLATAAGMEFTRTLDRRPGYLRELIGKACRHPCGGTDDHTFKELKEEARRGRPEEPPREVTYRIFSIRPGRFRTAVEADDDPVLYDPSKIEAYLLRRGFRFPDLDEALLAAAEDPELGLRDMGKPKTCPAICAFLRGEDIFLDIAPCCAGWAHARDIYLFSADELDADRSIHVLAVRI